MSVTGRPSGPGCGELLLLVLVLLAVWSLMLGRPIWELVR